MKDHKITICVGTDFLTYERRMNFDSDYLENGDRFRSSHLCERFICEMDKDRQKDYIPFWNTQMNLDEVRRLRDMLTETINYFATKAENGGE